MSIPILHQNDRKIPIHGFEIGVDDCSSCTQKICCTIFDIIDEENQGRNITIIKNGGKTCDHLTENGECCIYKERIHHKGYAKSCHHFSCSGIGPILDRWIIDKNIDMHSDSKKLSYIFQELIALKTEGRTHNLELEDILKNSESTDHLLRVLFGK